MSYADYCSHRPDPEPERCPVCGLRMDGDCSEDHERAFVARFDQWQAGLVMGYEREGTTE